MWWWQAELGNLINSSALTLLRVINDILDLARVESGKLELDIAEFNLIKVLDDACDTIKNAAAEKGLEVYPEHLPGVYPNPDPNRRLS